MKKIFVYIAVLMGMLLGILPNVSAQEPVQWMLANTKQVVAGPGEFDIHVGDTVVVSKNQRYYLTGDTIRKWVYNVCAVVKKIGGQRFPDGILLQDINSWITPEALLLVGAVERPQPQPQPQPTVVDTPKVVVAVEDTPKVEVAVVVDTQKVVVEEMAIAVETDTIMEEQSAKPARPAKPDQLVQPNSFSQHRLSLGVRGGVTSLLQDAGDAKCKLGWDALLDLQYAYYGITSQKHQVGFLVGVSAGYTQAGMTLDAIQEQYTTPTSDGDIQYTVTANNMVEKHGLVTVEIPIMFSFITSGGFFINIGPKVQMPVYSHYTMKFDNPNVDAYFVKERVPVRNELITGRLEKGETKGKLAVAKYNLLAGLELGYEWKLKNGDALALGAFADYNVYTFYRGGSQPEHVFDITAPSAAVQPAQIEFNSLEDIYGKNRLFLDCGLKLTYHFVVGKSAL